MKGLQRLSLLCVLLASLALVTGCGSKTIGNEGEGNDPNGGSTPEQIAHASQVISEGIVYFDFDKFDIRPEYSEMLRQKSDLLKAHSSIRIRIEGHTDERGTEEYNLALGERRARASYEFLLNLGVNAGQLEMVSFGKLHPAVEGTGEAVWAKNRRDEFKVSKPR